MRNHIVVVQGDMNEMLCIRPWMQPYIAANPGSTASGTR